MKKEYKYKFVHIAFQGGVDFINNLINFFNSDYNDSELRQNLWITRNHEVYEKNKEACDIVFSEVSEVKMIDKYGGLGEYIIVHGLHSNGFELMLIKPWLIKRIIWRTWGHDINLPKPHPTNPFKTLFRYCSFIPYYHITKKFALIGTANIVDDIKVKNVYGQRMRTVRIPYCRPETETKRIAEMLSRKSSKDDGKIRIMVGHSGFSIDKHIPIINSLSKFVNENIVFYIMLPYGDPQYMKQVESFAAEKLGNHCIIFKDRLPFDEYVNFIRSIDIAILGMQNSSALGNVSLLVYYKKKIYLNSEGDIAKGFDYLNLPYGDVDMIDKEQLSDFIKPVDYNDECRKPLVEHFLSTTYCKSLWNKVFSELFSK